MPFLLVIDRAAQVLPELFNGEPRLVAGFRPSTRDDGRSLFLTVSRISAVLQETAALKTTFVRLSEMNVY